MTLYDVAGSLVGKPDQFIKARCRSFRQMRPATIKREGRMAASVAHAPLLKR